jgi:hypothetical protein
LEEAFLDELWTLEGAFADERLTVDRIVFDMTVPEAIVAGGGLIIASWMETSICDVIRFPSCRRPVIPAMELMPALPTLVVSPGQLNEAVDRSCLLDHHDVGWYPVSSADCRQTHACCRDNLQGGQLFFCVPSMLAMLREASAFRSCLMFR